MGGSRLSSAKAEPLHCSLGDLFCGWRDVCTHGHGRGKRSPGPERSRVCWALRGVGCTSWPCVEQRRGSSTRLLQLSTSSLLVAECREEERPSLTRSPVPPAPSTPGSLSHSPMAPPWPWAGSGGWGWGGLLSITALMGGGDIRGGPRPEEQHDQNSI